MRTLRTSIDARIPGALIFSIAILSGCSSGSSDSTTVDGDVPIAYVKRPVTAVGNPTEAMTFTAGGDLYMREKSSPSAPETNVTGAYTNGHGDVSDPEVSYDGTKLLFAMRCETGASASCLNPDNTGNDSNWRIWEYDIGRKTFTRIRCNAGASTPPGDDVDPAYLPDGRIVFVSNRQVGSRQHMAEEGVTPFAYLDEYERQRTTALHVMGANGQNCHQISYNQSHDRNPTVLQNGDIMYSRWDHVGGRNQFTIFTTHVDGTELFVKYGAHSGVVSYLHPREMPNGQVLSDAMPLSRTHEGGALMTVDIANYSEIDEPGPNVPMGGQGQVQPTAHIVNFGMGISQYGRFTTPYPLWDGTNRALVTWTASCAATNTCIMTTNPLTGALEQSDENTPPVYGVYMLDLGTKSMRPVVIAPPGYAVLDPVAIQPRPVPGAGITGSIDSTRETKTSQLNTIGVGILDVQSVYDTDDKQRMGDDVLVAGLGEIIPKVTSIPSNPAPNQCYVSKLGAADICKLKDPAQTTAAQRPARFIRVTRAVPTQSGISRAAIGETDFEMQQVLGYVPIEPDGSFRIEVPADIPLGLTVVDSNGRGFQTHTSWIQVRPGEIRTCHGCHSPRRDNALNVAPNVAGYHSNVLTAMAAANSENMAGTRARTSGDASLQLQPNLVYTDIWTDPAKAGRAADLPLTIDYSGLPAGAAPVNGVIDYETSIAPLWAKQRALPGGGTGDCATCHDGSMNITGGRHALDLRNTTGGAGRQASYDSLLIGDPQLDANNQPVLTVDNGEIRVVESEAQVVPGLARGSHLIEVLFKQELKSAYALVSGGTDHSAMLNASEKRLVSEWVDLGAQYYNSPRDSGGNLRGVTGMDQGVFDNSVHAILLTRCGSCHQPVGVAGAPAGTPNANFVGRRFVLTGDPEGDFNVTLSMVGDRSQPTLTELLRRPASTGTNPTHGTMPGGGPILPTTPTRDPDYVTICNWISTTGTCP